MIDVIPHLVYLDTSAYLNILVGEKGHQKVLKALEKKSLCTSTLMFIEAERSLIKLSRESIISNSHYQIAHKRLIDDKDLFYVKDLTLDLALNGRFPAVLTPKSADLVHLRTALWFLSLKQLCGFLTLDKHQKNSAIELGLPVLEI